MDPAKVSAYLQEGRTHLNFVIKLYNIQLDEGRHFLHEHPDQATSWSEPGMIKLMEHHRTVNVTSDQCEYGLLTPGPNGQPTPAKKPTKWLTSSHQMAARLSKRCQGGHPHQPLLSGRAKDAAFYPVKLITEMLRGIKDTFEAEHPDVEPEEHKMTLAMARAGAMHDLPPTFFHGQPGSQELQQQQMVHDVANA